MTPKRTIIYYLSKVIFIFSEETPQNIKRKTKLCDIVGYDFLLDDNKIVKIASLSIDDPKLEVVFFQLRRTYESLTLRFT